MKAWRTQKYNENVPAAIAALSLNVAVLVPDPGAGEVRVKVLHACPVPLTVRGTQALVGFAPLAPSVFCAARQNAVLRRSPLRPT